MLDVLARKHATCSSANRRNRCSNESAEQMNVSGLRLRGTERGNGRGGGSGYRRTILRANELVLTGADARMLMLAIARVLFIRHV